MLRKIATRARRTIRKHWLCFSLGFFFAVVCFVVTTAVAERFSTPAYCGSRCHEMKPAYRTWELSAHHTNSSAVAAGCIDCHLPPRENFFSHMFAKTVAGARDIYRHYLGGEYDAAAMRRKVLARLPDSRCRPRLTSC